MNASMPVAEAHPIEAIQYSNRPAYKGFFLPNRSSRGPYINCPSPVPIKKEDKESDILVTVVPMDLAMSGKPGRYISMEKGTMAVKRPSNKMVISRFCLVIPI